MVDRKDAYSLINDILSCCRYYSVVTLTARDRGITRFSNSDITQNVYSENLIISVRIADGNKEIYLNSNVNNKNELKKAISCAEENLKFIPDGNIHIPDIVTPEEIIYDYYDKGLKKNFNIWGRAEYIRRGIETLEKGYSASGILELNEQVIAIGSTNGMKRFGRLNYASLNILVSHLSGASGYSQMKTNKSSELDVMKEFETATVKANAGLNTYDLPQGEYTVIMEPLAVGTIINNLSDTSFSSTSLQSGKSFFAGKIGQRILDERITIKDDTNDQNTIPLPFDYEGVERKKLNIITNGIAGEVAYDMRTAAIEGKSSTGHSSGSGIIGGCTENLIMSAGDSSMNNLIQSTQRGILVTKLHYVNVIDSRQAVFTGSTRDGTFLIENGKIHGRVKNLRFTESMLKAFNSVSGISKERKKVPSYIGVSYVPAVRIEKFNFTGKAE